MDRVFVTVMGILGLFLGLLLLPYLLTLISILWRIVVYPAEAVVDSYRNAVAGFQDWEAEFEFNKQVRAHAVKKGILRLRQIDVDGDLYGIQGVLRESLGACSELHTFVANLAQVEEMSEIADHPICQAHREHNANNIELALYRLASENVLRRISVAKMMVGLDVMKHACGESCMLLRF